MHAIVTSSVKQETEFITVYMSPRVDQAENPNSTTVYLRLESTDGPEVYAADLWLPAGKASDMRENFANGFGGGSELANADKLPWRRLSQEELAVGIIEHAMMSRKF